MDTEDNEIEAEHFWKSFSYRQNALVYLDIDTDEYFLLNFLSAYNPCHPTFREIIKKTKWGFEKVTKKMISLRNKKYVTAYTPQDYTTKTNLNLGSIVRDDQLVYIIDHALIKETFLRNKASASKIKADDAASDPLLKSKRFDNRIRSASIIESDPLRLSKHKVLKKSIKNKDDYSDHHQSLNIAEWLGKGAGILETSEIPSQVSCPEKKLCIDAQAFNDYWLSLKLNPAPPNLKNLETRIHSIVKAAKISHELLFESIDNYAKVLSMNGKECYLDIEWPVEEFFSKGHYFKFLDLESAKKRYRNDKFKIMDPIRGKLIMTLLANIKSFDLYFKDLNEAEKLFVRDEETAKKIAFLGEYKINKKIEEINASLVTS